ncbi:uncharacterized protein SPPG_01165 [Spizellomyces punctatus DAOM BR117]|uniref:peptidyl-tRNA hydrolase n=1 Tax=Spizellomyces punctatus (strain DAOM BR117) TaxID=645134 RepID=A0A0L0HS69_SPIPD|nr:uncharacterized protein SPPG_01165 [Spizellomyces punctatus DAOM BR117]KND03699.1 hypothetical protein SPPG_01165 [Spizellomyces punctatus DAOM BR117]|eukprot:XP_016611738.1 hypothetical protein SPPG_01165 [Spizellomyces punctatus DAOM BR117]
MNIKELVPAVPIPYQIELFAFPDPDLPSASSIRIQIQKSALEKGLPIKMVKDAGRTQVPRGSLTVLAIIGPESTTTELTGHLKLL